MRILLTNDDGYDSEGLSAVADLFKDENEITVVAPDTQKSASSHSITLPPGSLKYREITHNRGYKTYAVQGSPADCVKAALTLLFRSPDIVISGINNGQNLGSDIWYSGTVSAASDAAHCGIPSLALSLDDKRADYGKFVECAKFVKKNIDKLLGIKLPPQTMLNINFPKVKPRGVKCVKMNTQKTFIDDYVFLSDGVIDPKGYRNYDGLEEDSDEHRCREGYITITPLLLDRTDYKSLGRMKGIDLEL